MISKRYFRYAQNNFDLYKVQLYIFLNELLFLEKQELEKVR